MFCGGCCPSFPGGRDMKLCAVLAGVLLLSCGTAGPGRAEDQRWSVLRDRSSITLSVRAVGVTQTGRFSDWTSSDIRFDPEEPERADATIDVHAGSLTMQQASLTRHALGPAFLDAENHPLIRFRLVSVRPERDGRFIASADISIKGRTRSMSFPVDRVRAGGVDRMTGGFTIDRRAYGVGTGGWDGWIGRDVRVDVSLVMRQVGS